MPVIGTIIGGIAGAIGAVGTALGGIGSFLGGLGFIGKALIGIGLNIAAAYLQKALTPGAKEPPGGVQIQRQYGANVPRQVACGLVGVAGHDCYVNTYGNSNKFLQQIYVISDFYCDSLSRVAINGTYVTLDTANPDPEKGFKVTSGEQANLIWIKFVDGKQTVADPYLIDKANPSARWSANHIGVGVSYILVSMTYNKENNAQFPDFFFEFKGAPLYDPRKDSTVGGTGLQRENDQSTWEFSDNPIVIEYNYRRGFSINGDMFCGMGMQPDDLPLAKYFAAMNLCDEEVAAKPRYRCSIILGAGPDTTHADNIESILLACGGMAIDGVEGSWPLVGSNQPIVMTLTDDDLIIVESHQFRAKHSMADLVNSVSGNYPNPEELWGMVGYEAQIDNAAIVLDRRTRDINIDFPQVPDNAQAEYLASIYLKENRFEGTAVVVARPRFQVLEPGDWIEWDSERYGLLTWMVTDAGLRSLTSDGPRNAQLSLQQRDGSIYNTITPSVPVFPAPPGAPLLMTEVGNFQVIPVAVTGDAGRKKPAIFASWDAITDETVTGVEVRWYPSAQPDALFQTAVPFDKLNTLLNEGVVADTEYSVQSRIVTNPMRETVWSAIKTVVTPNESMIGADILDGAITELKLADQAVSTAKLQVAAVTNDILAPGSVTNTKIADAAISITKFAANITPVEIGATLPVTGNFEGRQFYNTTDGVLYSWDASTNQWVAPTFSIAPGSITSTEIADGAISTPKLATNAVTADKILANSVTAGKIAANAVTAGAIAAGAVIAGNIAANTITARELVIANWKNLVPDNQLLSTWTLQDSPNWVAASTLANVALPGVNYLRYWVSASASTTWVGALSPEFPIKPNTEYQIGFNWVRQAGTNARILGRLITRDATGGNQVLLDYVNNDNPVAAPAATVTTPATAKIGIWAFYVNVGLSDCDFVYFSNPYCLERDAANLIVDGGITANHIAALSITAGKIAAGAVTTDKILAGAVTAQKITVANLAALGITVRSADIQNAAITSPKLHALEVMV